MQPTWKTVLATSALGLGGLLGMGASTSLAQAPARDATTARTTYTPTYPAGPATPSAAMPGYAAPGLGYAVPPGAAMSGYTAPGYTAPTPRPTTAMTPGGAGDPSIKPGPPPYPPPTPPKEPSRMRKALRFLFLSKAEPGDGTRTIHIDPATGRTDLANARPWMNSLK